MEIGFVGGSVGKFVAAKARAQPVPGRRRHSGHGPDQ